MYDCRHCGHPLPCALRSPERIPENGLPQKTWPERYAFSKHPEWAPYCRSHSRSQRSDK